tara:strand:+ start:396 stop:1013 length:618 start_codon:yes stop_codon:yes gene_type:complete
MATIDFRSNDGFSIGSSGLGFFGAAGFGASVKIGEYQDRTYITNSNGTAQGAEVDNVKFSHSGSGIIGPGASGVSIDLYNIPNYQSTLNIRFTHGSVIQTQNAVVQIYDRVNTANFPSGVTCKVAEIIHPELVQSVSGSGDTSWITPSGATTTVPLIASPGLSGVRPNGASTSGLQHDWYLAVASSPDSIGSKDKFGLYFSVEYV